MRGARDYWVKSVTHRCISIACALRVIESKKNVSMKRVIMWEIERNIQFASITNIGNDMLHTVNVCLFSLCVVKSIVIHSTYVSSLLSFNFSLFGCAADI